jgi:hypothetical protein
MADLALAIPYDKWIEVLRDVKRILKYGGRLEIIDDQLFFPYGEEATGKDTDAIPNISDHRPSTPDTASLEASYEWIDKHSVDMDRTPTNNFGPSSCYTGPPSLKGPPSPTLTSRKILPSHSQRPLPLMPTSVNETHPSLKSRSPRAVAVRPPPPKPTRPLPPIPQESVTISSRLSEKSPEEDKCDVTPPQETPFRQVAQEIELAFSRMLEHQYQTAPHVHHKILEHTLGLSFGNSQWMRVGDYQVALAPESLAHHTYDTQSPIPSNKLKKNRDSKKNEPSKSIVANDEKQAIQKRNFKRVDSADSMHGFVYRSSPASTQVSLALSDGTTLNESPRDSFYSHTTAREVPPGLVIYPSTFIPLPPGEVEWHACKHAHTLLGCRSALMGYLIKESKDSLTVDDCKDLFWSYQR